MVGDGDFQWEIPLEYVNTSIPGHIFIPDSPPFEATYTVKATGYPDRSVTVNQGIPPVLPQLD